MNEEMIPDPDLLLLGEFPLYATATTRILYHQPQHEIADTGRWFLCGL